MSYNSNDLFVARNSRSASSYQIEQSLRFDGSSSLYRDPSSAGNQKTWTFSFWLKMAKLTGDQTILMTPKNSGYSRIDINSAAGSSVNFLQWNGSSWDFNLALTANRLRDPSAWYHIVVAVDTTQSTASNRIKFYVNGSLETEFYSGFNTYPSQNYDIELNGTGRHYLGLSSNFGAAYLNGYLAEVNYIDGSQLAATDFGEYDNNGVWRPIEYSGSYTGNSYYLKFDTADVDGDSSGLSNDWTASGFTTSGTGTDVMSDTPTTNWCTLNPLKIDTNTTLSEGNLRASGSSSTAYNTHTQATFAQSSGKWYHEVDYVSTSSSLETIGWARTSLSATDNPTTGGGLVYRVGYGDYINLSGSQPGAPPASSTGDILQVAIDLDAGKIWFGSNGTWFNSGNPAAGTNAAMTFTGGAEELSPCVRTLAATFDVNFGQRAFAYTPPTGFSALNTSNLPAPDIADGSEYFKPLIYLPDGSSSFSVTGVGFQPDFSWIKSRNYAEDHQLNDAVRGATKALQSNLTSGETTQSNGLTSFDSDGFTVGNLSDYNYSGDSIISWNWLAGGSGSSNTDGTITSTVSANPTAGFSIVTYTGTGSAATVGHGLGVAPNAIFLKSRNLSSSGWKSYFSVLGDKYLDLNNRNPAYDAGSNIWNDTAPTSTVFSIGNDYDTNNSSSATYVAYCFAEVEGYSKFGSFTGNGSSDGPFVYCGFRPAWIMLKRATGGQESWQLVDTARRTYNPMTNYMSADTSNAEASAVDFWDQLSNGFKLRNDGVYVNGSGDTYVFAAFAENPFGGDGVSPATAR